MPKLPKHIEDKFDKEFPRLIISINESPWDRTERIETDGRVIKSFIATILDEERERIVTEIKAIPDTDPQRESDEFDKGLKEMKETIIDLIK